MRDNRCYTHVSYGGPEGQNTQFSNLRDVLMFRRGGTCRCSLKYFYCQILWYFYSAAFLRLTEEVFNIYSGWVLDPTTLKYQKNWPDLLLASICCCRELEPASRGPSECFHVVCSFVPDTGSVPRRLCRFIVQSGTFCPNVPHWIIYVDSAFIVSALRFCRRTLQRSAGTSQAASDPHAWKSIFPRTDLELV